MKVLKLPLLWLILFCAWAGVAAAVEITAGPTASVSEADAVLKWTTDVECGTLVKFGRNPSNLNRRVEGTVGVMHEARLTELLPGTTYFYSLGTSKRVLKEGTLLTRGDAAPGSVPYGIKRAPQPTPVPSERKSVFRPAVKPVPPPSVAKTSYTPPPSDKTWGDRWSLQDHFNRHGADFGAATPNEYAAKAWLFLQQAKDEGLPAKLDESDGTIRVWDGRTHSFAAYNRNFTTKTFFRPESADYFKRQPGKPVRLRHDAAAP